MLRIKPSFNRAIFLFLLVLLDVRIVAAAELEFFSPRDEVKKVRQVVARFEKQLVSFGDPREVAPFDIDCPRAGQGRWANQRNWIYDFKDDLPAGVSCTFKLKAGLVAIDGQPLQSGERYSFNTGGPTIIQSEPREGSYYIDEKQVFILGLDTPATAESIQRNVFCQVGGLPEQIPVRILTGVERKRILQQRNSFLTSYYAAIFKDIQTANPLVVGIEERGSERGRFLKLRDDQDSPLVVLQCTHTFPGEARVSLVWGKGIVSTTGIPTSSNQILPFSVRPDFFARFSCERVNQDADCIPVLPMRLELSAPISIKDARKIRLLPGKGNPISPLLSAEDKKNEFVQYVSFPVPLPELSEFKLEVPTGLKDDSGRTLSNQLNFPLTVRTDAHPPLAKFAASFGILELNAAPALPVTLRNVEASLAASLADTGLRTAKWSPLGVQLSKTSDDMAAIKWLKRFREVDDISDEQRPGMRSIFANGDKKSSLTITKPLGDKAFEVIGIPLKDPGFYVVELASPRLGEALHGEKLPYYVHAAALVTNLSVHFKQGRESSLVWVTSLDKGLPVKDANVAVRDCAGKVYFHGRTDAQGLLPVDMTLPDRQTLPPCLNDYDRQYFVTASSGNDMSFVFSEWNEGIALWRFNAYQNSWGNDHNVIHAVLDRTLLRAGETVHMKLIARGQTRSGFAAPKKVLPTSLSIIHQGSDEKFPISVKWDGQGIAVLDWQIPKDAKQGSYVIQIPQGPYGGIQAGEFRVESFRVPTMKAILQGPTTALVNVDTAAVGIQINYLSGGGASNLPVRLRGQLIDRTVSFPDYEDFTFANGSVKVGPQKIGSEAWYAGDYELAEPDEESPTPSRPKGNILPTQNLLLDGAGAAQASFTRLGKATVPQDIQTELEYRDPNGETLTASSRIPLWPANVVVGIKPDGWIVTADHLKFAVVVLDLKGKPVVGSNVSVASLQRKYFSHRRRLLGGFYAYENRSEIKALGELCQGQTDDKGLLLCDVKAPSPGNIILQASTADTAGNSSSANREVWVAGDKSWWFDASDNDRIDLLPEKKRYEPGETARIQLRMPFKEATVLVTTEREGVMESFVTHVTRESPLIEVPIKSNYAPNVFISALVVRGRVDSIKPTAMVDLGKPAFKMGLTEVKVGWAAHELKVKVGTDKSVYKVRDKAKVVIDVRRADGSIPPAGTEIAIAAVDEGLLELRPNDSWDLLAAMMKRRGIEVSTSTAQMQVIGKRHFGRKALAAGGGGGKGSAREMFDTLLFWQARIKLDEQGHGEAVVPLNDSLTSFRIVAVANGGLGMFGSGAASVRATQDLMLLSGIPPVVREQDSYRAVFTVRNASDKAMAVNIEVKLTAGKDRNEGAPQQLAPLKLNLAAGEAREIAWDAVAPIGAERMNWDVIIREQGREEIADHLKVSQKIIAFVPVRTLQATIMQLTKPEEIMVKLPEGAIPGRGGVSISMRSQLNDGLPGVQEYMSRYPYSCFEQNASKAIALQDKIAWQALMKSLTSYMDRDGLVKYFPIMFEGDDNLTAYLLAISDEMGYELPESARDRMVAGLTGFVEGRVIRYSSMPTVDLSVRKLAAISALAHYGEIKSSWLDSLMIEPNLWPTSAVLDWLSILKRTPTLYRQRERLEEAQQIIRSRLNFQGTTMGFSTERSDALWWLMIDSDVNANRALLTLLDMPYWNPDIPRLVLGSLGRQQQGHWSTTVANAWGVVAMKRYSEKFESLPVTGNTTATIDTEKFSVDWNKGDIGVQKQLAWPKSTMPLKLEHAGEGRPWATIQSLAALPLKAPLFTGYQIQRKIIPIEQKERDRWHRGDIVKIHLDIDAQSDMTWVVVDDPVPGGATILGTGLGGDSKLLSQDEKKQGWVWPAFEERTFTAFHAYYRFVPKGKFTLEYTVRLNNEGSFNLPPSRVEAMYAPEMFGELPNDKVVVRP